MQDQDNDAHAACERLIAALQGQVADLRQQNDDLRESLATERKRAGFGGFLSGIGANVFFFVLTALATQAWSRFQPYYFRHMPVVWGFGFVGVSFLTLAICMTILGRNVYREWTQARAAGGALGVYNVQFRYSVIASLAGAMMLLFAGGPTPDLSRHWAVGMMLAGAAGVAYNYRRGKGAAAYAGLSFPTFK
jgi:hypothetical protein